MNVALVIGAAAAVLLGAKALKARQQRTTQPASGLHGTPTQTREQAGVHQYDVQRWPPQPDGFSYVFVKMADTPVAHGVFFKEGPGPGQAVQRTIQSGTFGPPELVNLIRGEWIIGG